MELRLSRRWFTDQATVGELFIDGVRECFTLEDQVRADRDPSTPEREAKVPGRTAIPAGTYRVTVTWSPRFQTQLPRLADVPGFTGILIHAGNTAEDTQGCILVGRSRGVDAIYESRKALAALLRRLEWAEQNGDPMTITIVNEPDMTPEGGR